jgi:hypothetical protein
MHSSNIADSDAQLVWRPRVIFVLKLTTGSHLTSGCIRTKENPAVARVQR